MQEGVSGFLVPPSDDRALGAAMLRLMALPEAERDGHGRQGKCPRAENDGLARVVERYEGIYREVLGRNGLAAAG